MKASHLARALLKSADAEQQNAIRRIADIIDELEKRVAALEAEVKTLKEAKPKGA
jgi:hypothetical protein